MTDKKTMFINGKEVEFTDEPNILEVIRKQGINVPTFCYRPDLKPFGSCRMCVVEVEGRGVQSSCTMPPEPGLKIHTNTKKVRDLRKTILELLISNHDRECLTCPKSGTCELQRYCEDYGVSTVPFAPPEQKIPLDTSSPSLVRDPNKCILCGACVRACEEYQGHAVLGFANRGSKTLVQPMCGMGFGEVDCVNCGQCAAVCPTGAITIKQEQDDVWTAISDPNKKVVAQIAPAVRVALGEKFGLKPGQNVAKLIVSAMKKIGFDLVFDTNFTADLTIMEEGTEFLQRIKENKDLPIFTSCCPAWVRYMELKHPDMLHHLSTARSPQGMMGSIIREFIPTKFEGFTKENIYSVSIMPCTAKKYEIIREELLSHGKAAIDTVITTQELANMIKAAGIDFDTLEEVEFDSPFGEYSGAAVIFGASGGVAEAAARTALELAAGKPLEKVDLTEMRGLQKYKQVVYTIGGTDAADKDTDGLKITIRIVNTLAEAEKSIQEIKNGTADFQMLEVMACPGGCISGGGQPHTCGNLSIKKLRAEGLYADDEKAKIRKSHENPQIKKLYEEWLGAPCSHKSHEFLHTHYSNKFTGSYQDLK